MNQQEKVASPFSLPESSAIVEQLAAQHGFSREAAQVVWQSLRAGGGTMAQFSHPELGGTGQWAKGGMIMIGDLFNHALKARVEGLCSALANLLQTQPQSPSCPENASDPWWEADLGAYAARGSQNNMRYAYFPARQRLAVHDHDQVTIYDTGGYQITGVSQQQCADESFTFISQHGPVRLADLAIVSVHSTDRPLPESKAVPPHVPSRHQTASAMPAQEGSRSHPVREGSADLFYKIERLAELRDKGILSEEEFVSKKTELLTRL